LKKVRTYVKSRRIERNLILGEYREIKRDTISEDKFKLLNNSF